MKKGFFLVTLENSKDVNPVQLASAMLRQVLESKHSLAPECVRVVPLQHFCCCSVSAIKLALEPLLSPALQATGAKEASVSREGQFHHYNYTLTLKQSMLLPLNGVSVKRPDEQRF